MKECSGRVLFVDFLSLGKRVGHARFVKGGGSAKKRSFVDFLLFVLVF